MPVYRCANCQEEAEHPAPGKCLPCGLDAKEEPRDAASLVELAVIHFDPPHKAIKGRGKGHAACNPKLKIGRGVAHATGEREHVTCPGCKFSTAFGEALDAPVGPTEDIKIGNLDLTRERKHVAVNEAGEVVG